MLTKFYLFWSRCSSGISLFSLFRFSILYLGFYYFTSKLNDHDDFAIQRLSPQTSYDGTVFGKWWILCSHWLSATLRKIGDRILTYRFDFRSLLLLFSFEFWSKILFSIIESSGMVNFSESCIITWKQYILDVTLFIAKSAESELPLTWFSILTSYYFISDFHAYLGLSRFVFVFC